MLQRVLDLVGRVLVRHPVATVLLYGALVVAAGVVAASRWQLKTDQNDLVGADLEYNQRYLRLLEEFADLEYLYVVIEIGEDPERAAAAARAVADEVAKLEEHVEWVFHRVEPEDFGYGLLYRSPEELSALAELLRDNRETLEALGRLDSLERLVGFFARLLDAESLAAAEGAGEEQRAALEQAGSVLGSTLAGLVAALEGAPVPTLRRALEEAARGPLRERGYLVTGKADPATGELAEERFVLVEILPAKDTTTVELIREPLLAIRGVLDAVRERFPGVSMGLTGRPVLQADEMMTTDRDMRRATLAAFAGVFVLFVAFFRRLVRPFLAISCLGAAIVLTFGLTMLTIGYLTLLSIVFAAMLVGLGIDFGIHFVARYQEELDRDGWVDGAIRRTVTTTGASIGTGAVTTAAAFYMTLFVDFEGLRELGFIAGTGVLLCFVTMTTLLPALIVIADRTWSARFGLGAIRPVRVPLLDRLGLHPWRNLAIAAGLTVAGLVAFDGLPYSANLLDLQAQDLESVEYEMRLIEQTDFSTWYAAFVCGSLDEVRATEARLASAKDRGIVGKYESALTYLPDDQDEKLRTLGELEDDLRLSALSVPSPATSVDPDGLAESLLALTEAIDGLTSGLSARGDEDSLQAARELFAWSDRAYRVLEALEEQPDATAARLVGFQSSWMRDIGALLRGLQEAIRPRPVSIESLPDILRRRLVSKDGGRFVVYAYAQEDIWQEEPMERFITAMREIDPDVTGAPVQVYESAWRMRDGFLHATLYSFGVVFLFLLIDLRSLRDSLLAMVPLALGMLWLLEALPLVGLTFNLANFFALPILVGCGIDGGVHLVHRFRECGDTVVVGRTTAAAVTLSYLTTMIGFGAMALASHRGVASLGGVMVWGLLAILAASVVVLPSLLRLVELRRRRS